MYQAHSSKHACGLGNKARTHSHLSNYFSHPYSVNARRNMLYVIDMCAISNGRVQRRRKEFLIGRGTVRNYA